MTYRGYVSYSLFYNNFGAVHPLSSTTLLRILSHQHFPLSLGANRPPPSGLPPALGPPLHKASCGWARAVLAASPVPWRAYPAGGCLTSAEDKVPASLPGWEELKLTLPPLSFSFCLISRSAVSHPSWASGSCIDFHFSTTKNECLTFLPRSPWAGCVLTSSADLVSLAGLDNSLPGTLVGPLCSLIFFNKYFPSTSSVPGAAQGSCEEWRPLTVSCPFFKPHLFGASC